MKKGSKYIIIVLLVSVLLSFFAFPVGALSDSSFRPSFSFTNNISDYVAVNQTSSFVSVDGTYVITGWDNTMINNSPSQFGLWYESYLTGGGYSNETKYAYVEHVTYRFSFRDGQPHSGYISFTNSPSTYLLLSDNDNVAITNNRINYYNVVGFEVYVPLVYFNQTTVAPHSNIQTLTLTNYVDQSLQYSDIEAIKAQTSTLSSYLESIYSRLGSGNSSVYSLLALMQPELADQGLTLDSTLNLLNKWDSIIAQLGTDVSDILSFLQNHREYSFPWESFSYIHQFLNIKNNQVYDLFNISSWIYPIFHVSKGDSLGHLFLTGSGRSNEAHFIFFIDSNVANISDFSSNGVVKSWRNIALVPYGTTGDVSGRICEVVVGYDSSVGTGEYHLYLERNATNIDFIPICIYRPGVDTFGFSEDFERFFGVISSQSQEIINDYEDQVSDVIDSSDEFGDYSDQLHDMDVGALEDMEDSLQDIDTEAAGNILSITRFTDAANWVRTQYNRMTINTPFASLISFSLTIGIVLILLGKLRT